MTFVNQSPLDFSIAEERAKLQAALESFRAQPPRTCRPIIAGTEISAGEQMQRFDPSEPDCLIGTTIFADTGALNQALQEAAAFQDQWAQSSWLDRILFTRKLAALMRDGRLELCALIIREAGKPWKKN